MDELGRGVIAHHVHAVAPFDQRKAFGCQALEFGGFHLGAVLLPEGVQRLYIAIDRDPAGQRAAERLSARATEVGITVRLLEPRLGDFNDDLRAYGKDALRQHLMGQIGPEDRHRLSG